MKKILLIFFTLFIITGCSKYEELNNLSIISNIAISYEDHKYVVTMQEIIPKNDNNKIDYDYKYRTASSNNIEEAFSYIINHSPKKIYLMKVQNIIIENKHKDKIVKELFKYCFKKNNINKEASVIISNSDIYKIMKINSNYKYIDSILKNKKRTLSMIKKDYKKKRESSLPFLSINNKELIFKKFIYSHVY